MPTRRETKAGVRYDVGWRLPDGPKRSAWKIEKDKALLAAGQPGGQQISVTG